MKNYNFVMTSKKHKECTDRVYEAVKKDCKKIKNNDVVICIQGDEPMLHPNMIESVVKSLKKNKKAGMTILGMEIVSNSQFISNNMANGLSAIVMHKCKAATQNRCAQQ